MFVFRVRSSVSLFLVVNNSAIGEAVALLIGHRMRTCDLQVAGSSPVWVPLRICDLGEATYTRVPLVAISIIWYRPREG